MARWNYFYRVRTASWTGLAFGILYFSLAFIIFSGDLLTTDLRCESYIIDMCPLKLRFYVISIPSIPAWPLLLLAAGIVLRLAEYLEWEWLLVQMDDILESPYEYVLAWMIVMISGSFVMYVFGWLIEALVCRVSKGVKRTISSRSSRRR